MKRPTITAVVFIVRPHDLRLSTCVVRHYDAGGGVNAEMKPLNGVDNEPAPYYNGDVASNNPYERDAFGFYRPLARWARCLEQSLIPAFE